MSDEQDEPLKETPGWPLTKTGLPAFWGYDPERLWPFLRWWFAPAVWAIAPTYVYGVDRVPTTGGAVVASNHFGTIDPPLVGAVAPRTIYYMTKDELVETPIVGEILRWSGAFSVRRGEGDRDALRVARWLVREGHMLGMFMEGTRQSFGYPGEVHSGAAMVAIKEGVPVVPCGIDTFGWRLHRRRWCCVVWGEPMELDDLPRNGRGYKEGAGRIQAEMMKLWRQAGEASEAGYPEQLPDGATRSRLVAPWECHRPNDARAWPVESWARGPLGPLYAPLRRRARRGRS